MKKYGLIIWIIVSLFLIPFGCAGGRRELLMANSKEFNRQLRWRLFDQASRYILPEEKIDFIGDLPRWYGEELNITNYEVLKVEIEKDGKSAEVIVIFHYHRYPSITQKRVEVKQNWKLVGGNWYVVPDFTLP